MSIRHIASAIENGSATVTVPAHVAGDLIILHAYRTTDTTAISLPSGFTQIQVYTLSSRNCITGYKIASGTLDATLTATGGEMVSVDIYRGVLSSGPIGGVGLGHGNGAVIVHPAVTMTVTDGTSWIWRGISCRLQQTLTVPTGFTRRNALYGGIRNGETYDTAAGVTSAASQTMTESTQWRAVAVELIADPNAVEYDVVPVGVSTDAPAIGSPSAAAVLSFTVSPIGISTGAPSLQSTSVETGSATEVLTRGIDPVLVAEFSKGLFYPITLVWLDWPDDPVFAHSNAGAISWNGETWLGVGDFGSIDIPQETLSLAATSATISLIGIPPEMYARLEVPIRNRDGAIYVGAVTERRGNILVGNPTEIFSGYMDSFRFTMEDDDGNTVHGVTLKLATGPGARSIASITHSAEDQSAKHPGDTAGRFLIYSRAKLVKLTWPED